jgi:hypothetical protein
MPVIIYLYAKVKWNNGGTSSRYTEIEIVQMESTICEFFFRNYLLLCFS